MSTKKRSKKEFISLANTLLCLMARFGSKELPSDYFVYIYKSIAFDYALNFPASSARFYDREISYLMSLLPEDR